MIEVADRERYGELVGDLTALVEMHEPATVEPLRHGAGEAEQELAQLRAEIGVYGAELATVEAPARGWLAAMVDRLRAAGRRIIRALARVTAREELEEPSPDEPAPAPFGALVGPGRPQGRHPPPPGRTRESVLTLDGPHGPPSPPHAHNGGPLAMT